MDEMSHALFHAQKAALESVHFRELQRANRALLRQHKRVKALRSIVADLEKVETRLSHRVVDLIEDRDRLIGERNEANEDRHRLIVERNVAAHERDTLTTKLAAIQRVAHDVYAARSALASGVVPVPASDRLELVL